MGRQGESTGKAGGRLEEDRGKAGGRNVADSGSDIQIWFLDEVVKYPSKDRESL